MLPYYNDIRTLGDIPDVLAKFSPDKTAIIFEDREISYTALMQASNQVANALQSLGLPVGSRVAFIGFDSEKSFEILFACAKARVVMTPINWNLTADEIAYILKESTSRLLFVSSDVLPVIESILPDCKGLETLIVLSGDAGNYVAYDEWRDKHSDCYVSDRAELESEAVVQVYTSGTSGKPKGVVLAHHCFLDVARNIQTAGLDLFNWNSNDVSLLSLPTFHVGGLWWAIDGLVNGASNIVCKFFSAEESIANIEKYSVTKLAFVPAMLRFLISDRQIQSRDLSSVKLVIYGGSPMPREILAKSMELFKCDFIQNYGLSETCNMAVSLPAVNHLDPNSPILDSAGAPLYGVEAKIVDSDRKRLPVGQVGEILFKSPSMMLEYWNRPEETQQAIKDGWLYTGDAGYIDDQGFVYITARIKDLIISAGENIYPAEIENVMLSFPGIVDAAVIGIPDERWGEVPLGFIVTDQGETLAKGEVKRFLRKHIASFKLPRDLIFVESLPRNASGKVLKRVLREPYWKDRQRQIN